MLCCALIFTAMAFAVPYKQTVSARTIFDVEKELAQCKNELSKLQKELSEISKNITTLEGQTGQTTELLAQFYVQIEELEADISHAESLKESCDMERAALLSEIAIVQEDYEYRVSMYKKLIQFIYENSNVNSFELLFSSENFADYLTKRDHFNDIMNAADKLIKNIEISVSDLKKLDEQFVETKKKYEEYETELNRQKIELKQKVTEFETIAEQLNLNADDLSKKFGEKSEQIKQLKAQISKLENELKNMYSADSPFGWPVKTSSYRVTSQYGWRNDPFGKPTTEFHKGIDIACSRGTPILAVADGVVTKATDYSGYGECVIVYHGDGISSLYAHIDNSGKNGDLPYNSKVNGKPTYWVKEGDHVKKGQVIAYVGTTGRSTGYHLHFGVINNNETHPQGGQYADPNKYLPNGYYTKKTYNK